MVSSNETYAALGRRATFPSEALTAREDGCMKSLEDVKLMCQLRDRGVPLQRIAGLQPQHGEVVCGSGGVAAGKAQFEAGRSGAVASGAV